MTTPGPAIPAPAPPADEKTKVDEIISKLEKARGSRVIVYWLPPQAKISEGVVVSLYDHLSTIGKQEKVDLVLFTMGGDTEAPWRIVSLIREYCDHFAVLIPHRAHSAGTLLAMGADEIVMTPLGVLGPIDPSRTHPLLPSREGAEPEPISVQDMRHAMQFIREAGQRLRGEADEGAQDGDGMPYTPEAWAQIFTALFDKIHPLAIGAIEQSYALSKLVGAKCLSTHMKGKDDGPKIKGIVDKLCDEFKSHSYEISRREARDIGLKAVDAPAEVESLLIELLTFYNARPTTPATFPRPGTLFKMHIAWLDSTAHHMRAEGNYTADDTGKLSPKGDQWVSY